jgi:hypothetical protein
LLTVLANLVNEVRVPLLLAYVFHALGAQGLLDDGRLRACGRGRKDSRVSRVRRMRRVSRLSGVSRVGRVSRVSRVSGVKRISRSCKVSDKDE